MSFPQDIEKYVLHTFGSDQFDNVITILSLAVLHDGQDPSHRLIRCALVASEGLLPLLRSSVELIAVDYRDVIVAGEYATKNGKLEQVRDLSSPFTDIEK